MTSGRFEALRHAFTQLPSEAARLQRGLPELDALYRDAIRTCVPPNVQFERERIIADVQAPREIVFILGLLSEGENEAALLLELIGRVQAGNSGADVAHVVDEAWYYLRTSIDPEWQLDDGVPCASAALVYLVIVLEERLARLRALPRTAPLAAECVPDGAERLRALRAGSSYAR